jgi:hypothetical protein
MTRFKFFASVAILSALSATPAFAQQMIDEPGMFAFFHPNGDLGIASTRPPVDAMASLRGNGGMAHLRMMSRPHAAKRAQSGR